MSRVEELTKELTEAITDSCEYKRFKEFESEVMKRPDKKGHWMISEEKISECNILKIQVMSCQQHRN